MVHAPLDACALHDDATDGCSAATTRATDAQCIDAGFPAGFPQRNTYGVPVAVDDDEDTPIPFRLADVPDWSHDREMALARVERECDDLGLSELEDALRFVRHLKVARTTAAALALMLVEETSS